MREVARPDGHLDDVAAHCLRVHVDRGDALVQVIEAGIDLRAAALVLVLGAVVDHRCDVAGRLRADAVVQAPHLEDEARARVDRVEIGVLREAERGSRRGGGQQPGGPGRSRIAGVAAAAGGQYA
jgi:hypothetical protein